MSYFGAHSLVFSVFSLENPCCPLSGAPEFTIVPTVMLEFPQQDFLIIAPFAIAKE